MEPQPGTGRESGQVIRMSEESRIMLGDLKPGDVALLRDIAEAAAEKAVSKTFVAMGLDPDEPLKAQRDFNFLRDLVHDKELDADMQWLRRSRQRSEGLIGKAMATAIGLAVVGAVGFLWDGFRMFLKKFGAG